ncbi:hypothetical protein ACHAWC_007899 [Mediolabrus comicus]
MMEITNDDKQQHTEEDSRLDVSNANFITSLPNPLHDYATKCFSDPSQNNNSDDESQRQQQRQKLEDEFEISVRSHLLHLIEQLLSSTTTTPSSAGAQENEDDDGNNNEKNLAMSTLLRYLKDVSLLCHHIAITTTTNTANTNIKKLPFLLIEDTIDSLPLRQIQQIWSSNQYPNTNISSYITTVLTSSSSTTLFTPLSKFVLLRICNKILRLLSNRDVDADFAGCIMMLLSQVFPLSERSAINVLGGFNVDNEVRVESLDEFEMGGLLRQQQKNGDGNDGGNDNEGSGSGVGYEFYSKFWGVQKVFTDPGGTILASTKPGGGAGGHGGGGMNQVQAAKAYETFVKDVMDILEALESTPIVIASSSTTLSSSMLLDSGENTVRHHKYLTSSQLLHLQLKDPTLRIHFLTQLIIILSYLTSPSTSLPTGVQSTAGADTSKLTAQIRVTQMKQLGQLEKRVSGLLRSTTKSGEGMWKSLQWILRDRELMWKNWKKAKCLPAMDRVATAAGTPGGDGVSGSDVKKILLASSKKRKLEELSSTTMTDSNNNDGSITLDDVMTSDIKSSSSSSQQTTLTSFLEPYIEALDPENGIEGEYHPRNDKVYSWRVLRLMARDQNDDNGDDGVGGQLKRFGKLRRRDGDFEGIVREMWKEKGEEIPGGEMMENYYHHEEEEEEEVVPSTSAAGGENNNDAAMDDVSVGSTQEEVDAKKERMAEFEKAAMEVEEDMLNETDDKAGDTKEKSAAGDDDVKKNGSDTAPVATATEEPAKEENKKDEKATVVVKEEKKTESKKENGKSNKATPKEEKGASEKDNSNSKSAEGKGKKGDDKGKNGDGKGKKDDNTRGSATSTGGNNKTPASNEKNGPKSQPRSRAKFTPPQKVQQNKSDSRDNSNSRGGGGGDSGGRRGSNNDRRGNNMPPPPQSRGGNRDGRAHSNSPVNHGGGGGGRGNNNSNPRGGGPGRGWEPPPGAFAPGRGGGGGRGGSERDSRHRRGRR